jgi:hypothetical protein
MVAEYVADKEKVKLVHVVYRGGGAAIQDLVAGHVKVGSMTLSTTQPHILAGKLKPLAISSEKRVPEFRTCRRWSSSAIRADGDDLVFASGPAACRATSSQSSTRGEQGDGPARGAKAPANRNGADRGDDSRADDRVHAARSEPMGADGAAHRRNKMNPTRRPRQENAQWFGL